MGKIEMMMKISCSVIFEWDQVVIHQAQCNFTIHTYFLLDQIISKSSKLKEEKTNSAQFTQSSCHNRCHCHCHRHLVKISLRLTNPERQMKHENRLSLFLTDSHGKIIDFQKIEEELGSKLVRGKAYNSATWPFSKFLEKI